MLIERTKSNCMLWQCIKNLFSPPDGPYMIIDGYRPIPMPVADEAASNGVCIWRDTGLNLWNHRGFITGGDERGLLDEYKIADHSEHRSHEPMILKDINGNDIEIDRTKVDEFTITGSCASYDQISLGNPISAAVHYTAEVSIMGAVYLFEGDEALKLWQSTADHAVEDN